MAEEKKKNKSIKSEIEVGKNDTIHDRNISDELKESFLEYAMSVIVSRAIPDSRDGLKPVQRRILYVMKESGMTASSKTKKSANVVGLTMAGYHPHGDMAIYDSMVRMAQDFSLRIPLVKGQGNFGCFTGDTKISLTDGRDLSFVDLIKEQKKGKSHWGYTFNTEKKVIEVTKIIKPRLTRKKAKLVEVTLDNNEKIKCTLDHKFLMRDGSYKEANLLQKQDSLMPLYIEKYSGDDKNLKNYKTVLQPFKKTWEFIHQLSDKWNIENNIYTVSAGKIRHHKDFDKFNNNPDNIQRIQWGAHWKLHKEFTSQKHKTDPEYVESLQKGREKYWSDPKNREKASLRLTERNNENWKDDDYKKKISNNLKNLWKIPEMRDLFKQKSSENLKRLWQTEGFKKLLSELKSKELKQRWQDPKYRKEQSMRMKQISQKIWSDPEHRKFISENSKKMWRNSDYKESMREKVIAKWNSDENYRKNALIILTKNGQTTNRNRFLKLCEKVFTKYGTINAELYKKESVGYGGFGVITFDHALEKYFNNNIKLVFEKIKNRSNVPINHKVKTIKFLKKTENVYDITTEPWHNFALACGVFVHNSIDGDPPAASRYTECKLSNISDYLFEDIDKDTVNFVPNYDGSKKEPSVLPVRFPQLLINGTTGIAVSMATSIAPHNLTEVMDATLHLIDHSDDNVDDLMQFIKGPDFPTGGIMYGIEDVKTGYATGKGRALVRGRAEIVDDGKKSQIIITEIPYMVNKSEMIKHIAHLVEDKKIIGIKDLRDESDKDGMRVTIDLKSDANPQGILNQLYKYTELEKYFYMNQIALTEGGLQPRLMTLKDLLVDFINHRKEVVLRRTQFLLKKYQDRLHILEGLATALDHIDEIIKIIKKSSDRDEALRNLCKTFKFSEIQANAILETKLQALAKLEEHRIEDEIKEKNGLIKECNTILKDEKKLLEVIKTELKEVREKFVEPRRTEIKTHLPKEVSSIDLIPEENVLITLSKSGYIKRMNSDSLRTQQRGGKGVIAFEGQNPDDFLAKIISANTKDYLLFFTDKGKVYQALVYDINESSRSAKGKALQNFINIDSGETITAVLSYNPTKTGINKFLVMATKKGVIKKTKIEEFANIRKTGLLAINLEKEDVLMWASFSSGDDNILLATSLGQSICMSEKDVRPMGRATAGVCGMKLGKNDFVIGLSVIPSKTDKNVATLLTVSKMGYGKRTPIKEYRIQKRGGTGIKTFKVTDKTKDLIASRLILEQLVLVTISKKGLILKTELADVSIQGRTTQGVRLMNLNPGDEISEIETL